MIDSDRCASSRCRLNNVTIEQVFIRLITMKEALLRVQFSLCKKNKQTWYWYWTAAFLFLFLITLSGYHSNYKTTGSQLPLVVFFFSWMASLVAQHQTFSNCLLIHLRISRSLWLWCWEACLNVLTFIVVRPCNQCVNSTLAPQCRFKQICTFKLKICVQNKFAI